MLKKQAVRFFAFFKRIYDTTLAYPRISRHQSSLAYIWAHGHYFLIQMWVHTALFKEFRLNSPSKQQITDFAIIYIPVEFSESGSNRIHRILTFVLEHPVVARWNASQFCSRAATP